MKGDNTMNKRDNSNIKQFKAWSTVLGAYVTVDAYTKQQALGLLRDIVISKVGYYGKLTIDMVKEA